MEKLCGDFANIQIKNKGSCAGEKNTNKNGLSFECSTNNERNLQDFAKITLCGSKKQYYLSKPFDDKKVKFFSQQSFKTYVKNKYDIQLFRKPDEEYIIENGKTLVKILEKKTQNVEGSVETKLWSAPAVLDEYKILFGKEFIIQYAFCINTYFQNKYLSCNKKYETLQTILEKHDIKVLFGDDKNYFEKLNEWIYDFDKKSQCTNDEWIYGS